MSVKIFTEGGKKYGLGHVSRCSSLYDTLIDRGIDVDFIIFGDISDVHFLRNKCIQNKNWIDVDYLNEYLSEEDYVIVDSYLASQEHYELIASRVKRGLYIDDIGRLKYPKGIVVNPALDASGIDYIALHNRVLSGADFIILRTAFTQGTRQTLRKKISNIMVTMGGSDIRNITPLITTHLCTKKTDIHFDIIIGSDKSDALLNRIQQSNNVEIHTNVDATKMKQLMLKSDLAITAAGQTIYELIVTQTPFIPIKIIDNQENNINALLKYNPKQVVFTYDDVDLVNHLINAIDVYDDYYYRREQNMLYNNLIDGRGAKRMIDALLFDM